MKRKKAEVTDSRAEDEPSLKRTRSIRGTPNGATKLQKKNGKEVKPANKETPSNIEGNPERSEIDNVDGEEEDDLENYTSDIVAAVISPRKSAQRTPNKASASVTNGATPKKQLLGKKLFATPVKANEDGDENDTPRIERNANRSARRKSTRTLIERTILGNTSDNDEEDEYYKLIKHKFQLNCVLDNF